MKKLLFWGFCLFAAVSVSWHAWLVYTQHNADKAGVFLLMVAAGAAMVALYKTSKGE